MGGEVVYLFLGGVAHTKQIATNGEPHYNVRVKGKGKSTFFTIHRYTKTEIIVAGISAMVYTKD